MSKFGYPVAWGPFYWLVIHLVALHFGVEVPAPTVEDKRRELERALKYVRENEDLDEEQREKQTASVQDKLDTLEERFPGMAEKWQEDKGEYEKSMAEWFNALPTVLPCSGCSIHCRLYLNEHPPPIEGTLGTDALFRWTVDFHNAVSERTGKTQWTHEEAREHYESKFSVQSADGYSQMTEWRMTNEARKKDAVRIKELEALVEDLEAKGGGNGSSPKDKAAGPSKREMTLQNVLPWYAWSGLGFVLAIGVVLVFITLRAQ